MTSPANSDFWKSALSEAKKVNNGISAKKEASRVRDWGGEGRGTTISLFPLPHQASPANRSVSNYQNPYLVQRLGGVKQKK